MRKKVWVWLVLSLVLGQSCTKEIEVASSVKEVVAFGFNKELNSGIRENVTGEIDLEQGEIKVKVPFGSDVTKLMPDVIVSEGADYSPKGRMDFSATVTFQVIAEDDSSREFKVKVEELPSPQNGLSRFFLSAKDNTGLKEDIEGEIDQERGTVAITVPFGTDVSALLPTLSLPNGATASPQGRRDFTEPVTYTITAADKSTREYVVSVAILPNPDNQLNGFVFRAGADNPSLESDVVGEIDQAQRTVTAVVPFGTDVTVLLPVVEVPKGADYSPKGRADFTNSVVYTVKASDGSTETYTVTVVASANPNAEIRSFVLPSGPANPGLGEEVVGIVDQSLRNIVLPVPYGVDVSALLPELDIPEGADYSPKGRVNLDNPVVFTVLAPDGSTEEYTVRVKTVDTRLLRFELPGGNGSASMIGEIDHGDNTVKLMVPFGFNLKQVVPVIEVPVDGDYSPKGALDFEEEVDIFVHSWNGVKRKYTVKVTVGDKIDSDKVLVFGFLKENGNTSLNTDAFGEIDHEARTIYVKLPLDATVNNLEPTLEVPLGSDYEPKGPVDFGVPVTYTVTGSDGSVREYEVSVGPLPNYARERRALLALYNANPESLYWPNIDKFDVSDWYGVTFLADKGIINLNFNITTTTQVGMFAPFGRLPKEMGDLSHLEVLRIYQFNGGDDVPMEIAPEIGNLRELTEIIIEGPISHFPKEIFLGGTVRRLALHSTGLTELPEEIVQSGLVDLTLVEHSDILEESLLKIYNIRSLKKLTLGGSGVKKIDPKIIRLTNLELLDLSSAHNLFSLPSEMESMTSLKHIRIQFSANGNEEYSVLWRLKGLESLSLTGDASGVTPAIGQLENLRTLYIQTVGNDLPIELLNLKKLNYLRIERHHFKEFPRVLVSMAFDSDADTLEQGYRELGIGEFDEDALLKCIPNVVLHQPNDTLKRWKLIIGRYLKACED